MRLCDCATMRCVSMSEGTLNNQGIIQSPERAEQRLPLVNEVQPGDQDVPGNIATLKGLNRISNGSSSSSHGLICNICKAACISREATCTSERSEREPAERSEACISERSETRVLGISSTFTFCLANSQNVSVT